MSPVRNVRCRVLQLTNIQEIIALIATCVDILDTTFTIIGKIKAALDSKKNGAKRLREIEVQVKITSQILEEVVKNNKNHHISPVINALELVRKKSAELEEAAQELSSSIEGGKLKAILNEFRGDSRIDKLEKLQNGLNMAQTSLITAMVASNKSGSDYSDINVSVVKQVDECFCKFPEVKLESNYPRQIINLLKQRGEPVEDGTICTVTTRDLENIVNNLPWADGKTIRIISDNKVEEFGLVSADVGREGEGRPHIDTVKAVGNKVSGAGYIVVGTLDYVTSMNMQATRMGYANLKDDKEFARNTVMNLVPGLAGLRPDSGPQR